MKKNHPILQASHVLLDGGVGSELYKRGVFINKCFEEVNLTNPSLVENIHREYVASGSSIITSNSWGANRLKLRGFSLENSFEEINQEAIKIAKKSAGSNALVAGSIGPLGVRIEPFGPTSFEEARTYFREQANILKEAGADCLSLETFSDLSELKEAILACKEVAPDLFLFAYLAIENEKETLLGTPLLWCAQKVESLGVDAFGLNCSVGPKVMYDALKAIVSVVKIPISLRPNAGFRKQVGGRRLNLCSPEYMSEFTKDFFRLGAKFVGGCCGTGPEHIRMMSNALRFTKVHSEEHSYLEKNFSHEDRLRAEDSHVRLSSVSKKCNSNWAQKIEEGRKVVCVELLPPESIDPSPLIEKTKRLKELGVDAINIPDGPRASARMSALLTSVLVERETGIETILHYTCRDRNILGIQSDMIGAQAIGLKNMLLITGDPPKTGLYPHATGVFDVDAIGLTNIVNKLNEGVDIGGKQLKQATSFSIGVGVNPGSPELEHELKRFMWKVKAGAHWAITQPVFDVNCFKNFIKEIEQRGIKIPIIAGIWPLVSYKNALFLHNEVPGIFIPDHIMEAMKNSEGKETPSEVGVQLAKEMMEEIKDLVSGFQISAPFGKIGLIEPLLEVSLQEQFLFRGKKAECLYS